MADGTQRGTQNAMNDIKSAVHGIKGFGDAIRGSFNESVDTAFHERRTGKNKSIADRGLAEMKATEDHFDHRHGPKTGGAGTHLSSATSKVRTGGTGMGNSNQQHTTATTAGAHSGAVGNMESRVPQEELGGEGGGTTNRF